MSSILTPELINKLADPRISLPLYGHVHDQETATIRQYDPGAITLQLQHTILNYAADPPLTDTGHMRWLVLCGYRQSGKSTIAEMAGYPLAMFRPGWRHVCYADTKTRADMLHERLQYNHQYWPEEVRIEQRVTNESRKLTFIHGGSMTADTAGASSFGVGQSPDFFHGSEVPLWKDAESEWTKLGPAMRNRKACRAILESTPYPMDEPSSEFFQEMCYDAYHQNGRLIYAFYSFWDGLLNRRPWKPEWSMDIEELRLMEKYGPKGLTMENLAFRRWTFDDDPGIRRNPALFGVFYPFDDVSCWLQQNGMMINAEFVQKAMSRGTSKIEWEPPYTEFEPPESGALYVIGADPAGFGRDHSAFHVLKVWKNEWTQVAVYGANTDPTTFAMALIEAGKRYNNAKIGVERNGVGIGATTALEMSGYKNIYWDAAFKPGVHKSSHDKMLTILVDGLMDNLALNDKDTGGQCMRYRGDKAIERTPAAEILSRGRDNRKRLERHHWDKVSALSVACIVARSIINREKPAPASEPVGLGMTFDGWRKYTQQVTRDTKRSRRRH